MASRKEIQWDRIYSGHEAIREYWSKQSTDARGTLNSFDGEWNFSDHQLIPDVLMNLIEEMFFFRYNNKISKVPLSEINQALNEIWQGPGSMPHVIDQTFELRKKRHALTDYDDPSLLRDIRIPTIEEFNTF